jgi:predicted transcriptional regulator
MPQTPLEIAKELTLALIETGNMSPENMDDTLKRTYATLAALKAQEETGTTTETPVSATTLGAWRKSITKHTVTCLECGKPFKQLSRQHLQEHGIDARSYRATYGIPRTQPLVARDTTTRRRQVVRKTRPWEKAPMYGQAQERASKAASAPEAEALRDTIEESAAVAITPPKRARKTVPKKTARKNRSEG